MGDGSSRRLAHAHVRQRGGVRARLQKHGPLAAAPKHRPLLVWRRPQPPRRHGAARGGLPRRPLPQLPHAALLRLDVGRRRSAEPRRLLGGRRLQVRRLGRAGLRRRVRDDRGRRRLPLPLRPRAQPPLPRGDAHLRRGALRLLRRQAAAQHTVRGATAPPCTPAARAQPRYRRDAEECASEERARAGAGHRRRGGEPAWRRGACGSSGREMRECSVLNVHVVLAVK
mmetsp:Transcript_4028/g.12947  ORF Transcript_4028/g.12947 Transcript_4028/m.12947 type:complete len:227 (+) Transcript_4028:666-1346(+)